MCVCIYGDASYMENRGDTSPLIWTIKSQLNPMAGNKSYLKLKKKLVSACYFDGLCAASVKPAISLSLATSLFLNFSL